MVFRSAPPEQKAIVFRAGGGYNSRKSEDEIDIRETSDGYNFDLDVDNSNFEPRRPFGLSGTAPNGSDIRGFAQVVQQDGTISTLIQAGATVYSWDGASSFNSVGTVSPFARLRGHRHSNFILDDKSIITDLALVENVMTWDGVTFSEMPTGLDDPFKAKYGFVSDNRAWFANTISGATGVRTPHMVVASERENSNVLSVSDKPSSALSEEDPFFLLAPDYRPINGMLGGLNRVVFSSENGSMYSLTGVSAEDFAIDPLYQDSAATGDEGLVFAGNDFLYGRSGFIESLAGSERFGDIDNDNISRQIENVLEDFEKFRLIYNTRRKKLYVLPDGSETIYVFHKPLYDKLAKDVTLLRQGTELSPWVPWTTNHPASFQPSCMWSMLNPVTRLEEVFFGDQLGNIYQMDAEKGQGDGGTTDIVTKRVTRTVISDIGREFDFGGWVRYRSGPNVDLEATLLLGGKQFRNQLATITMPDRPDAWYFGGDVYFGEARYWNSAFRGRIAEAQFSVAGISSEFQLELMVSSSSDFSIAEVGIEFKG